MNVLFVVGARVVVSCLERAGTPARQRVAMGGQLRRVCLNELEDGRQWLCLTHSLRAANCRKLLSGLRIVPAPPLQDELLCACVDEGPGAVTQSSPRHSDTRSRPQSSRGARSNDLTTGPTDFKRYMNSRRFAQTKAFCTVRSILVCLV